MRWSRLKKTINVDDIASSILDGKKRRTTAVAAASKARPSPPSSSSVKVESAEDGTLQLPLPTASAVGIILKEEEEGGGGEESAEQQELTPVLFVGLPKPAKCRGAGAEEQVSIPVVDEAVGAVGRFAATQVPHLPRVAEATAAAVEAAETGSQSPVTQTLPPVPVVRDPPTLKSEPEPQFGEGEEGKTMKSEPPPTNAICGSASRTISVVITAANGSKKRKVESM